jgi:hypothetical protein
MHIARAFHVLKTYRLVGAGRRQNKAFDVKVGSEVSSKLFNKYYRR